MDRGSIDRLRTDFHGELITPDSAAYESARSVHNGMIDRRPALIARCTNVADVTAALRFGREHDLMIAIRGGGHSVVGFSTCDHGIVLDLSPMKGIRVDPSARAVRAQGGVTWGEFDRETQHFGLATTGGQISSTGIAGLTLGGGRGWLERKHGLTCDNVLSFDVVTAEGRFITASEHEYEDLYWALRGGGGNFGIVTSFEYQLHQVGPLVLGGFVVHPAERIAELLQFYVEFMSSAPDELSADFLSLIVPPLPHLPEELHGQPAVGIAVCYAGPLDEGEAVLQPLRAFGPPSADLISPMAYTAVQRAQDELAPKGWRYYWTAEFLPSLSGTAQDLIADWATPPPTPNSLAIVIAWNGAQTRVRADATAFAQRDVGWVVHPIAVWTDPSRDSEVGAWARTQLKEVVRGLAADGAYLEFVGDDDPKLVEAFYGEERLHRLAAIKATYDPDNVFRLNHNIKPMPADALAR